MNKDLEQDLDTILESVEKELRAMGIKRSSPPTAACSSHPVTMTNVRVSSLDERV